MQPNHPSQPPQEQPQAEQRPRRILLAVTGLSPQVVTETLYALAVAAPVPWLPTEVHLVTTSTGLDRARHSLLSQDPGWFARLLTDYRLPPIAFSEEHIHLLRDADGAPLADIRTLADNDRAADTLTELVRTFTADPDSELHASIAGGRKTMGYYLGYALSLFGRPRDRLSHVLVTEPYESSWSFFYPTPYPRVIETRNGILADTAEARVMLAEIPFVPLRHGLPPGLLEGETRFADAVSAASASLGTPALIIDYAARRANLGGRLLELPPRELAFLGWFARRVLAGKPPLTCPLTDHPEPDHGADYLCEYHAIQGTLGDTDRTVSRLAAGMDGNFFSEVKSRLNRQLRNALGLARQHYEITALPAADGRRIPRRYALPLTPEQVRFATT